MNTESSGTAWLRQELRGGTLVVTFDRPPVNALNLGALAGLVRITREAEAQPQVRAIIFTSVGDRFFAAGADIHELEGAGPDVGRVINAQFQGAFQTIADCPKPTICALNGAAIGGGCEWALACDIRIAVPDAYVSLPEARLGLIPGGGGTQRLPRLIPRAVAKEMMFTGRRMSAEEGERLGLIQRIAPVETLLEQALTLAEEMAGCSPSALRAIKKAVDGGAALPEADGMALELEASARLFGTPEAREGLSAFLERRPPRFPDPDSM